MRRLIASNIAVAFSMLISLPNGSVFTLPTDVADGTCYQFQATGSGSPAGGGLIIVRTRDGLLGFVTIAGTPRFALKTAGQWAQVASCL